MSVWEVVRQLVHLGSSLWNLGGHSPVTAWGVREARAYGTAVARTGSPLQVITKFLCLWGVWVVSRWPWHCYQRLSVELKEEVWRDIVVPSPQGMSPRTSCPLTGHCPVSHQSGSSHSCAPSVSSISVHLIGRATSQCQNIILYLKPIAWIFIDPRPNLQKDALDPLIYPVPAVLYDS